MIASWDDYSQATLHLLDRHIETAGPDILEVGPGDGALLEALAQRAQSVTALDNSEVMLDQARQRAGHISSLTFSLGDARTFAQREVGFDAVVANMVADGWGRPAAARPGRAAKSTLEVADPETL